MLDKEELQKIAQDYSIKELGVADDYMMETFIAGYNYAVKQFKDEYLFYKEHHVTKAEFEQKRLTYNATIFDKLPKRFTKDDMKKLKPGASNVCLRQMIFRWTNDKHWITKIGDNLWRKNKSMTIL